MFMSLPLHRHSIVKFRGYHRRYGCLVVLFFGISVITSCATVAPVTYQSLPPLQGIQITSVEPVPLLELTPAMQRFLDYHVPANASPITKLNRLAYVVNHPGLLGFEYSPNETYTGSRSFDMRSGNCVAFSNMFIALARGLGLRATYQEMKVPPSWSERKDILLLALHLNVSVRIAGKSYTVDVAQGSVNTVGQARSLSDKTGATHYYNNLGVEALLDDDLGRAFGYFARGLENDPSQSFLWTNMGLIYKRMKQLKDAEWAYNQALKANAADFTAMNNLAQIYDTQNRSADAERLRMRAERYRLNNPYYLLLLSEDAFARGKYQQAQKLLTRAIKRKPREYRFRFMEAKIAYASGRFDSAEQSYQMTRELAPAAVRKKDFSLPLAEIMRTAISPST